MRARRLAITFDLFRSASVAGQMKLAGQARWHDDTRDRRSFHAAAVAVATMNPQGKEKTIKVGPILATETEDTPSPRSMLMLDFRV